MAQITDIFVGAVNRNGFSTHWDYLKRFPLYLRTPPEHVCPCICELGHRNIHTHTHTLTCISNIYQQQLCENPAPDSWAGSFGPSRWGTVWGTFPSSCELCSQNCECPLARSFSQLQLHAEQNDQQMSHICISSILKIQFICVRCQTPRFSYDYGYGCGQCV